MHAITRMSHATRRCEQTMLVLNHGRGCGAMCEQNLGDGHGIAGIA